MSKLAVIPPGQLQALPVPGSIQASPTLANAIKADLETGERYTRAAAFVALRVGVRLVMIRDLGERGSLDKFLHEHFLHTWSYRHLRNYIRIADTFLKDCGFKQGRLGEKDAAKVAPIFEEQLDLFLSPPKAKLEAATKKLVTWVADRGLRQILRDITAAERPEPPKNFGNAGGRNKASLVERARRDALETTDQIRCFMTSKEWAYLEDGDLAKLDNLLSTFHDQVAAFIKDRERAEHSQKGGRP